MKHQMRILQGLKLAAVLAVALSMGACANKNPLGADGAMASAATPGSQQDFVVNVGDRVFFESDQTELSPQAIATLEKQARWLQSYNRYSFTIEGHADERGTREYNIALGARRAQWFVPSSPRAASTRAGCAPSPTARNARSRCVTTSPAGRRTAVRSRC